MNDWLHLTFQLLFQWFPKFNTLIYVLKGFCSYLQSFLGNFLSMAIFGLQERLTALRTDTVFESNLSNLLEHPPRCSWTIDVRLFSCFRGLATGFARSSSSQTNDEMRQQHSKHPVVGCWHSAHFSITMFSLPHEHLMSFSSFVSEFLK